MSTFLDSIVGYQQCMAWFRKKERAAILQSSFIDCLEVPEPMHFS